jgi:pyruvate dehydrogenase E2 component (dihydrolipoamide acetyltransferase)
VKPSVEPVPAGSAAVAAVAPKDGHVRASPRARQQADALHIDLRAVPGTGPHGAITGDDVARSASAKTGSAGNGPAEGAAADRRESVRTAIARLMARSKREVPHYYLATTIEMSAALTWLEAHNRDLSVDRRLIPAVLLLKATALAATEVPEMNGFWIDERLQGQAAVHLGVAVSLRGGGLVAPAIHDAASLDLDTLMSRFKDVVLRARTGRLRGSEMSDPTITVTNLGDQGVEEVFGVIYVPQVALVGFGKLVERPWARDGLVGSKPVVRTTLSADHRASDGHVGARFLTTIDHLLQQPEAL